MNGDVWTIALGVLVGLTLYNGISLIVGLGLGLIMGVWQGISRH